MSPPDRQSTVYVTKTWIRTHGGASAAAATAGGGGGGLCSDAAWRVAACVLPSPPRGPLYKIPARIRPRHMHRDTEGGLPRARATGTSRTRAQGPLGPNGRISFLKFAKPDASSTADTEDYCCCRLRAGGGHAPTDMRPPMRTPHTRGVRTTHGPAP